MEVLLQNPIFRTKMKSLSPATRRWFIDALIDLFDQESEYVIDVIEDCREEMRDAADRYNVEAEQLRAASRLLQEKRESPDHSPQRAYSRVSAPSRLLYGNHRQPSPDRISSRLRHRRRRIVGSEDDGCRSPSEMTNSRCGTSLSSLSVPSLPALGGTRANNPSARTTRSLPVTPTVPSEEDQERKHKQMHEETRAILQSMNTRESQVEKERERQQDMLERMKRQKRYLAEDRTQQALKLLEKALEMDRAMAQDKEKQGLLLRNKLDEMKRRRGPKQDAEFVEIIELQEK
ncbi:unnamed protein product [Candidula unifasciata]|uniref:Uncharacterized protein n=1 Tax=Candidula unifasciata TaxID=100452 RepID=A0A8S3ZWB5_9EUPU|nr:unnamed protein product [Candidula unifasciata]